MDHTLKCAVKDGQLNTVKLLLDGQSMNDHYDAYGAALRFDQYHIVNYLIQNGVNMYGYEHLLVKNQNLNMLKYLVNLGLDLSRANEYAIYTAIESQNIEILTYLAQHIHVYPRYTLFTALQTLNLDIIKIVVQPQIYVPQATVESVLITEDDLHQAIICKLKCIGIYIVQIFKEQHPTVDISWLSFATEGKSEIYRLLNTKNGFH